MPKRKRSLKVFLCYARADHDDVLALYTRLTQDGVDTWLNKKNLLPGQDWELEIRKAVREADAVVICLSRRFNQSGYQQKETRFAIDVAMEKPEGEIFIIPARLEECDNISVLEKWHWVDLFESDGYNMLVKALQTQAEKIGVPFRKNKDVLNAESLQSMDSKPVAFRNNIVTGEKHSPLDGSTKLLNPIIQPKRLKLNAFVVAIVGVFVIFATIIGVFIKWFNFDIVKATSVNDQQLPYLTMTVPASQEIPPSATKPIPVFSTDSIVYNPHPDAFDYIDSFGVPMREIPEGEFFMGSENGSADERPRREVYLNSYYFDKYEVTNRLYKNCVNAGPCQLPLDTKSYVYSDYYINSQYNDYPIVNVDWNMAKTYCEWRGGQLPTEAQWEKAAKGTDGREYPWGPLDYDKANFCNIWTPLDSNSNKKCIILPEIGDISRVGFYIGGESPYRVYDMAGNVWEWVADWYSDTYYQHAPSANPLGPNVGEYRIIRGGSFYTEIESDGRSANRSASNPLNYARDIGFRCVRDVNP